MTAIAVGLGGNVGDPQVIRGRFERARAALAELGAVRSAALYRTAPIGPSQPAFLNTAVSVAVADELAPTPAELSATLQELERLLGRDRAGEVHWGPRPIDLDVLLWGARAIRTPELEVPHPRLAARRFALAPLIDLYGAEHVVPGASTLGELAAHVGAQEIELVVERW